MNPPADKLPGPFSPTGTFTVMSRRDDGLGERLRALTNAIYLASRLGYAFGFQWDDRLAGREHQSADRQAEVFCPEFIERYSIPADCQLQGFVETQDLLLTRQKVAQFEADPSFRGFICHQGVLTRWLDPSLLPDSAFSYRDAFNLIGFSEPVRHAIGMARRISLPPRLTALHLRGGDVIYGVFRRSARYQGKALPAPLAAHLIRQIEEEGGGVLLFGQDTQLISQLKAGSRALDVGDLYPTSFGLPAAQSLFEITVMSRCERIIAGSSGFALLAREMGAVSWQAARSRFSPEEQFEIIIRDLEQQPGRYSPLQVAFACSSAYMAMRRKLKPGMAETVLQMGRAADPENEFFGLMIAATCFRNDELDRGDRVLAELLSEDRGYANAGLDLARTFAEGRGGSPYPAEHETFHRAGERGASHAFLMSCYLRYFKERALPE